MIISHRHRYIFVHAPKTGGTSLALALEAKIGKVDILIGDTPKAVKRRKRLKGVTASGRLWKHSQLADIYGLVTQSDVEQYFVFTLVRNPWDRIVSYYHWLKVQHFEHPAVLLAQSLDFSGFIHHEMTRQAFSTAPYASFVTDAQGRERCDLFLRLEAISEDVAKLQSALGLRLPDLTHCNRSDRSANWRQYFSEKDAALVAEICATDIARFAYQF